MFKKEHCVKGCREEKREERYRDVMVMMMEPEERE